MRQTCKSRSDLSDSVKAKVVYAHMPKTIANRYLELQYVLSKKRLIYYTALIISVAFISKRHQSKPKIDKEILISL